MGVVKSSIGRSVQRAHSANRNGNVTVSYVTNEASYAKQVKELKKEIRLLTKRIELLENKQTKPLKKKKEIIAKSPWLIYVLRCEGDKYYIGTTTNIDRRFRQHQAGNASWFTKEYAPLEIVEVIDTHVYSQSAAAKLEDQTTISYMLIHGVDNVRGGGLIQRDSKWFIKRLSRKQ